MFCHLELTKANDTFSQKLETERYQQKDMITLSWKVQELNDLGESGRQVYAEIKALASRMQVGEGRREENLPRTLQTIRQKAITLVKGVVHHQRTAATHDHVLVFMISNEERNKKPYALPIQCLPYKGLSDNKVRELANHIIAEMVKRKMKVAGNDRILLIICCVNILKKM